MSLSHPIWYTKVSYILAGNLLTLRICQIGLHRLEEEELISAALTYLVLVPNLAANCCILCCCIQNQRRKRVGSLSTKKTSELQIKRKLRRREESG